MIYIDKYAYFNRLKDVHPVEKFSLAIFTLFITVASNSIFIPAISFAIMSLIILLAARIPLFFYAKLLLLPLFFLFAGVLSVATNLNDQDMICSVLFTGHRFCVSASSLNEAVKIFTKSMGSISCLYFLVLTVPVTEIINILKKFKTPILFLELLVIVYKFIFIIFETMDRIYISQKSRMGYENYKLSYKSLSKLISSVFIISLKRYEDLYHALESRCFTGDFHFYQRKYNFSKINIFVIFMFDGILLAMSFFSRGQF
ncbi:MAG: cobalt ECF transporter T component CbiQ [Spirochaetia bacterium]|nr:cobalt ECF transporter T component CbiQ [Spirochaetia bacterium]